MNDFNVFSYMDSSFMHTLDEKIAHIRPLRAIDFDEQEPDEAEYERYQQFHPHQHASPPKLLVCSPCFVSHIVSLNFHATSWNLAYCFAYNIDNCHYVS